MSKCKKDLNSILSKQGNLFDSAIAEGALDVRGTFHDSLSKAISACKDSRYQIAAKMSELTLRNISKDMLDKYTSNNPDYELKAVDMPAFLYVTGTLTPMQILVEPIGATIISPEETEYVRLARALEAQKKWDIEVARLEAKLGVNHKK
jgi:hypothetical protein